MRRAFASLFVALFIVITPLSAHAATANFFGPIISPACECPGKAAGWGCVMGTAQNSINFAVSIGIIIAVLIIAVGGFMFMTSATNPEAVSRARGMMINAVVGLVIVLAAWLMVDYVMKLFYNPSEFGPWNNILGGGDACLAPQTLQSLSVFSGPSGPVGVTGSGPGAPLSNTGQGACNATEIATAAAGAGTRISSTEANTLACLAGPESGCGTKMQNYNWNGARSQPPSTAYGPFQITLKGNTDCFEDQACYDAAGVSGPLNCNDAFDSHGNAIEGPNLEACKRAAANLACSAVAADCVYQHQGARAWTSDASSAKQQACIQQYGA